MDYSQLSDEAIDDKVFFAKWVSDGGDVEYAKEILAMLHSHGNAPRYCNNPSDIIPLMIEHKISLVWVGGYWQAQPPFKNHVGSVNDDLNPLRAASIVFIKMMEAKA